MRWFLPLIALAQIAFTETLWCAERVDYPRDVKPLLAKRCLVCHSPLRQKSGFRMDTAALLIQGGDMGPAVVPGKSAESRLIQAVTGTEGISHMPPEGNGERLTAEEIDLLRRWIDEGAVAPEEVPATNPREHWSFQPVRRPAVPEVAAAGWVRNPIDAFIAAEYQRQGLTAVSEAQRHVLLRRVYLDLTGLPPTREELRAFLADESPTAYEAAVDRLLASERYGERWGRHWMDIWRYSDWAGWGQQVRDSQPHIWHWRDWIIESLNADRPYDEMVVDMLAADELAPEDRDRLRATGFLVRNFKLLSREQWLQDTVEHTAKAFLGLTMNCARCHDHMTDPLEQEEYYQLRAIFEPHHVRLDRLPGVADTSVDALPRVFDKDPAAPTYFYLRGDERTPDKDRPITSNVPALLRGGEFAFAEVSLPRAAYDPLRQEFVVRDDLAASERNVVKSQEKLAKLQGESPVDTEAVRSAELQLTVATAKHAALAATVAVEQLEATGDTTSEAWAVAAKSALKGQRDVAVAEAKLAEQGAQNEKTAAGTDAAKLAAADKKLAEATAKLQQALATAAEEPSTAYAKRELATYSTTSTGRRSALARWIVDPRNPLAARVAVNHLWSRHFHAALVPSVFNFGVSGEPPVNQPLLDWLAAEFVDPQWEAQSARPWSMKHLHRLIVTSAVYRLASTAPSSDLPRLTAIDPDNRYLWRAPTRRMEAEVVRDSALYVAGQLDLKPGGPDIDHAQGLTSKRRSLYFRHAAEKQMLFLKLFDCASVGECYERRQSVVPQQALALANSELTLVQSRLLARALNDEFSSDPQAFVQAAMEQVLARPATDEELKLCVEFLAQQEEFFTQNQSRLTAVAASAADGSQPTADPRVRSREQLVHALLNHNDFVTIR